MQTNFNLDQLKKRLKENIEKNLKENNRTLSENSFSSVEKLLEFYNISEVSYYSHRKLIGKYIILAKKLVRKLLAPILNKQIMFNQLVVEQLKFLQKNIQENNQIHINQIESILLKSIDEAWAAFIIDNLKEKISLNIRDALEDYRKKEIIEVQKNEDIFDALETKLKKQISNLIFSELGDIYFRNKEFEISYQIRMKALHHDSTNLEQEKKALEAFDALNKSRNLQ